MNTGKPFKVSISPAQVISKASEIVKNNIPRGSNLNIFKQKPENCGISIIFKSDYGLIHNCFVSITALRCENDVATDVVIQVCPCEKMKKLYQKLIAEI